MHSLMLIASNTQFILVTQNVMSEEECQTIHNIAN